MLLPINSEASKESAIKKEKILTKQGEELVRISLRDSTPTEYGSEHSPYDAMQDVKDIEKPRVNRTPGKRRQRGTSQKRQKLKVKTFEWIIKR